MTTLKAVRGTRDLLPPETALWNRIEATARDVFARYNFGEIRTPVFEDTSLFARGVGEETDIVSKEMYTWEDRARAQSEKTQSLTLRPENTAGVVRAAIEHNLFESGQLQKLYYIGPRAAVVRQQIASARRPNPGDAGHAAVRVGHQRLDSGTELRRLGRRPRQVQRNASGRAGSRGFADVRGLPASRPDQSVSGSGLQGSRRPAHHRHVACDCRLAGRGFAGPFCRSHGGSGRSRCALHAEPPPRSRPRLLHSHHLRVHPWRAWRTKRPAWRRALRRAERDARRAQGSGHRLRHRRGPAGAYPACTTRPTVRRTAKSKCFHGPAGRKPDPRRPGRGPRIAPPGVVDRTGRRHFQIKKII